MRTYESASNIDTYSCEQGARHAFTWPCPCPGTTCMGGDSDAGSWTFCCQPPSALSPIGHAFRSGGTCAATLLSERSVRPSSSGSRGQRVSCLCPHIRSPAGRRTFPRWADSLLAQIRPLDSNVLLNCDDHVWPLHYRFP